VLDRINLKGMHIAAIVAMAVVVVLTIAAELSEGLKNLLVLVAFHHWIAKSIIALVVFVGITWIMNKGDKGFIDKFDAEKWGKITAISAVLFATIIFIFYLLEFFS